MPAAILVAAFVSSPARAAEGVAKDDMAGLFVSLCVENGPETARVETMAGSLGLKTITEMPGVALSQGGADGGTKAWRVSGAAGVPYALSTARGHDGVKLVEVCALADPAGAGAAVRQALTTRLKIDRPFRTEPGDSETLAFWRIKRDGRLLIVSIVTPTSADKPGVVLSSTLIARPPTP